MNWADYVILGVILLSALISLLRGFVREAFSLGTWILGFWIAFSFFRELSVHFEPWIAVSSVRLGVAFGALLLATLLIGALVGYLAGQLVDKTGLSGTDRLLGTFFGVARGGLIVAILILLAGLTPLPEDRWWHESLLIPHFQQLAVWLQGLLPADFGDQFHYL